jgi:alpha-D-ribose 1-methylphosphonate 5-triphosphate synthase subunit PhnG
MAALAQGRVFVSGPMRTWRQVQVRKKTVTVKCQRGYEACHTVSRRSALLGALFGALIQPASPSQAAVASRLIPLADLPMERLRLPKGGVGKDYVLVKVSANAEMLQPGGALVLLSQCVST